MGTGSMDSVHYFVRGLFRGIAESERMAEQREELETHLNDRIADCMAQGRSHDEAFALVVESLGNLDELIEAIIGEKKKVLVKKADWLMMAAGILYGTLYMTAVGIWFAAHDFGLSAIYIAIPGWLGFLIPALIKLADYRKHPLATALVSVDRKDQIRSAVLGWLSISAVCWIVNFLFLGTPHFLNVVWAWMPTFGLLTWPMMVAGFAWMVRNLKSIDPETAGN